jgi:hypothetical protein
MNYLCNRKSKTGALVQLVRIHACHAWGHGSESHTHRNRESVKAKVFTDSLFLCHYIN